MITFTEEYWEESHKKYQELSEKARHWLNEHQLLSLNTWLDSSEFEFFDLVDVEVVEFSDQIQLISGPEHNVALSDIGKRCIGIIPVYEEEAAHSSSFFSSGFEIYYGYIKDEENLLALLKQQVKKTKQRRAEKYYKICEKYNITVRLSDECLPFEVRTYIEGPYCDIKRIRENSIESNSKRLAFCSWCGNYILQNPRFLLNNIILCFKCCKLAYNRLDPMIADINSESLKHEETSIKLHKSWQLEVNFYLRHKPLSVRFAELFGESPTTYKNQLLKKHPEPLIETHIPLAPAMHLVDNPFQETGITRQAILKRDNETCQLCGIGNIPGSPNSLEVHHIVPKAAGGKDSPSNLITLCKTCHDHEDWFGHVRAFKTTDKKQVFDALWEFEIIPDLLEFSQDQLRASSELLETKVDWVQKAKKHFLAIA